MNRSQMKVSAVVKEEQKKEIIDPVTCSVCYEDVERIDLVKYGGKFHDICSPCFVGYLETQIMENKVWKYLKASSSYKKLGPENCLSALL